MKKKNYNAPALIQLQLNAADIIAASNSGVDEIGVIELMEHDFGGFQ